MTGSIITWNIKHIIHTPVTVKQYLGEQIIKSKAQIPGTFWSADQQTITFHIICMQHTPMYMNHDTNMISINSDEHNQSHNTDKNNSDQKS